MSLRERVAFWGQMWGNFDETGALQPSSRALARSMTAPLRSRRVAAPEAPLRILEIGPGTGAVTRVIAEHMGPEDTLECYEINPAFVRYLRGALESDTRLRGIADRLTIRQAPAQELAEGAAFDFVLCSAPLNNFDGATIDAILEPAMGSLVGGGSLTLFEYVGLPKVRRAVAVGHGKTRLVVAQEAKERWVKRYGGKSVLVLGNLPPARVHELTHA